jgi:hypoxanthine phosphoribosyltransferase
LSVSGGKFECEVIGWELFYSLAKCVSRKIKDSGYQPDLVVGLARGGWVLARVLCDFLCVKDLISLKVEHWGVTATPDGRARLVYPFYLDLSGRRVLVVDDITDTGQSMRLALNHVKKLNPAQVRTATLRHIEGSEFVPDYVGDEITWRWVVFPWNFVEDLCNIVPRVSGECSDMDELRRRLKEDFNIDIDEPRLSEILEELERRSRG